MKHSVVWITGLPGTGKTTIAKAVVDKISEKLGVRAVHLDGDSIRSALNFFEHSRIARKRIALAYQGLARMLTNQGFVVVVSTVSLFHEVQDSNREILDGYFEVFLDVPKEFLMEGPRSELYSGSKDLDPSLEAQFPKNPDIRLSLDSSGARAHWLPELVSALGMDL